MKKFYSIFAAIGILSCAFVSCEKSGGDNNDDNNGGNGGNNGGSTEMPASLKGSDYIVLSLGDEEYEYIEDNAKVCNMMPYNINNDESKPGIALYIWDQGGQLTYSPGEASGINSYGFGEGWVSFVVAQVGWSGAGYSFTKDGVADRADAIAKFAEIEKNPGNWYFHFAYKSEQDAKSHVGGIAWKDAAGNEVKYEFVFGDPTGTFDDGGKVTNRILPVSGEYRKGEWNEYEIKISDTPIDYSVATGMTAGTNLFWMLSGPDTGTTLDLDAIFFYRK